MENKDGQHFYESQISSVLEQQGVTRSTMMGFPCLRNDGDFFASCDHKTGDLIVKLTRDRVNDLIRAGTGKSFSPAGRPFKEWVMISNRDEKVWSDLLNEAHKLSQKRKAM